MKTIDYTKFGSSNDAPIQGAVDKRWWLLSKQDLPQAVTAIVNFLGQYDSKRQTQYQISTRMYGNTHLMGLNGLSYAKITAQQNALKDRISYNVVQSCTDTISSKMAKNKPRPLFLTSGGDYKLQRKAKKLDKFVEGIFYENDAYKLGPIIFRDACILGDGIVHVFNHYGRVKYERIIASELYVDWVEAFYGEPRQLHRVKNIDRQVLIDQFPEKKNKINEANSATADMTGGYQNIADQVAVIESWHLPSGPEAKDGIHTICLENDVLFSEEWTRDHFPFAFLPWCKRLYGFWSQGLAEQIQNIQLEINKILWIIQRSMHLCGTFKIWMKNGSKIVKEHFNNEIGSIIVGDEQPVYLLPPAVQPEFYTHLQTLKTLAFEQAGISMLSAASQKPAGLDSGKALREFNNIESDRFMTIGQSYEQFFLQLGRLSIETAKEIYETEGKMEVRVPGKKFIETIDWKDVDLEDDEFYMKMFPVSSLPNDPAGRLQTITEYIQAGFLSPRAGRRLLDFPDLEQVEDIANSQEDWIHEILEKIVDDGELTPPEPEMDLSLASELVLQYYGQAQTNNLEPEKLEMLRTFNDQVKLLIQKAMPPPSPVTPNVPQANPEPTPTSPMIPNVPGAA